MNVHVDLDTKQEDRQGTIVGLEIDGRGWSTSYSNFYMDPSDDPVTFQQQMDEGATEVGTWNLGVRFEVNTEFDLSWRFPFYINKQEENILYEFAPILHLDLNAWASMEFHIWFWNIRFATWIQPYTFTPFDVAVHVDPAKPSRWCHGMDYYGEALSFEVTYE